MDFYDVISSRRSIRSFQDTPIPKAALNRIAEAVNLSPSACNRQPWRFEIHMNEEKCAEISHCCSCFGNEWMKKYPAPAIAVVIGNREKCWKRPEETPIVDIDAAIAMEHFVLAATAEWLGTCWICAYQLDWMDHIVEVSPDENVVAVTPLGYAAQEPFKLIRKPIEEVFRIVE